MSKKLSELTRVTTASNDTLFYLVDPDRNIGDRSVGMNKDDVKELVFKITNSSDISVSDDELLFSDRDNNVNGQRGYKYIREDFDWSNIPSSHADSILEIRNSFDLGGSNINLPNNCELNFKGGFLYNGTININGAKINGVECFGSDIVLSNNVSDSVVNLDWFVIDKTATDLTLINSIFGFTGFEAVFFPSGIYTIDGTIQNPKALDIYTDGLVTINARYSASPIALQVGEIDTTLIETLSTTFSRGSKTYTFTSHSLVPGDIVCIIDDSNSSFSSYRTGYKKGEYLRVFSVSGNAVTFNVPVDYDYPSGSLIHKCELNVFNIVGDIRVIAPSINNSIAVKFTCLRDNVYDNIKVFNGSFTCISITKCLDIIINNVNQRGERLTGLGGDYAMAIVNSQNITANGHFKSSRHALSTGSDGAFPELTCKNIKADGIFETDGSGNVLAVDTHGNTDGFVYTGIIKGGCSLGGTNGRIDAIIYAGYLGVAISFSEMKNWNFNFANSTIKGNGSNPGATSRGTISIGGNTNPYEHADNFGCMNFSNITLDAPDSTRPIFISNNALHDKDFSEVRLNFSGFQILAYSGTIPAIIRDVTPSSGNEFKSLDLRGFVESNGGTLSLSGVSNGNTAILKSVQGGRQLYNGVTTATLVTGTVTFGQPFPITPNITATLENNLAGGRLGIGIYSISQTGFTWRVNTVDGANMGTSSNQYFNWIAT